MADNDTTIEIGVDKNTENYAVYEAADEDTVVGMYVSDGAAEAVGEFATLTIGEDENVEVTKDKDTANYGVFSSAGGAISGMYVSHDALDSEESEEGEPVAPDAINLTLTPSDEDTFENAAGVDEAEEESLVESSDESDESDEEEIDIADEEVGLVDSE